VSIFQCIISKNGGYLREPVQIIFCCSAKCRGGENINWKYKIEFKKESVAALKTVVKYQLVVS
jgi:hypothetical protein